MPMFWKRTACWGSDMPNRMQAAIDKHAATAGAPERTVSRYLHAVATPKVRTHSGDSAACSCATTALNLAMGRSPSVSRSSSPLHLPSPSLPPPLAPTPRMFLSPAPSTLSNPCVCTSVLPCSPLQPAALPAPITHVPPARPACTALHLPHVLPSTSRMYCPPPPASPHVHHSRPACSLTHPPSRAPHPHTCAYVPVCTARPLAHLATGSLRWPHACT